MHVHAKEGGSREQGGNLNYTYARFTSNQAAELGTNGNATCAAFNTYPDTPTWSGALYADIRVSVNNNCNLALRADVYDQASNWFSSTGQSLNPNTQIAGYTQAYFRSPASCQREGRS